MNRPPGRGAPSQFALAPVKSTTMANPHSWATFNELFADHAMFASQWPKIMDGYAGPNALEPALVEAAMVAVNSVKDCSF